MTNCVGAQLVGDPFRMTNWVWAQLGSATCGRSFQDDKLGGGATWERKQFSITHYQLSINPNLQSLSCWKHLTAKSDIRKFGWKFKHHKTKKYFVLFAVSSQTVFSLRNLWEILSGWQTAWGRNLRAQLVWVPFRITNWLGAQLGSATCVRSFQDDKLCGGATWGRKQFSITHSQLSINPNLQSLSCWKHLTAKSDIRKFGWKFKHHKTKKYFVLFAVSSQTVFSLHNLWEILSGWQTGWGRNLGAQLVWDPFRIRNWLGAQLGSATCVRSF